MSASSVSVIIPTYNRSALIGRAVRSALAAIADGDEVIVVDDGSTDDTAAVLAEFGHRIRYVASDHVGPGAIRNLGVRHARSDLVAFLDSDDEWMPDKLALQRAVMSHCPDALFCFSDFAHRNPAGAETRRFLRFWHHDPRPWDEILGPGLPFSSIAPLPPGRRDFQVHVGDLYFAEMHGDYVCTSTVLVRRREAGAALRFAEDLMRFQDWECFGRLAAAGRGAFLDCETQWNCAHAGQRLTRADPVYAATARLTVLQRVWGGDARFLRQHDRRYRQVLARHRRARGRALMHAGRTREARSEFRLAGWRSLPERMLAVLPGGLALALIRARRRLLAGRPGLYAATDGSTR